MPLLTLYFQLHQPFRFHPDGVTLLWDEKNREIFTQRAEKCYIPTLRMFSDLVHAHHDFKISLGMSGTFLEQAQSYKPEVIDVLKGLLNVGQNTRQVEFLEQPYYYSAASFFADPHKTVFKVQVSLHRQRMNDVFGVKPSAFLNTALSYSNDVANIVADMGFKAILCEPDEKTVSVRDHQPIDANRVYRAIGRNGRPRKLAVLPRHKVLSRRIASICGTPGSLSRLADCGLRGGLVKAEGLGNGSTAFSGDHRQAALDDATLISPQSAVASARQCADLIHETGGEVVVLVCDFPLVESDGPAYRGMVEYWNALVEEITRRDDIVPTNPTEVAEWFQITDCPMVDCPYPTNSFLSKAASDAPTTRAQRVLLRNIESLEAEAKQAGGDLVRNFRYLTASDHLRYLQESGTGEDLVGDPTNPYDSVATAAYALTHATDELSHAVKNFNILKQTARTPVIVVTPETGRLPSEGMGQFAKYVSGKSGGLGEVISALCKGLSQRNIPVHLITLNLIRRFRE